MANRAQWVARQLISGEWVLVYPNTSKPGVHMRRVDAGGHFTEADARAIVTAMSLAARVARLNAEAGEIGAGMLADLIEQARRALAE